MLMKKRFLSMLVLLVAVVSGAWATPNSIFINGTPQVGDKSISLTYYFDPANVPGINPEFAPSLKVKCAADNKYDEIWLSSENVSSGTTNIPLSNLGEFEAGKTYELCFAYNDGNWVDEVCNIFVPAAPTTYAITLAEGTEDAGKWTISPNPAAAGSPVTATYSGDKKVKSVKAVKKGGATVKSAKDATAEDLGKVIGIDGKIYNNVDAAQAAGTTGVAMIVYVGSATGEASYTHGLALALKDARNGSNCIWRSPKADAGHDKQTDSNFTTESGLQYNNNTHNSDTYRAFKEAMANNNTDTPTGCSAWFLPTGYQWNQMINACKNVLGTNNNQKDLRDGFSGVGGTNLKNNRYWSSTENDADKAWRYDFGSGNWGVGAKNINYAVRSAIAF